MTIREAVTAFLAGVFLAFAAGVNAPHAATPKDNVNITLGNDGNVDSKFLDGDPDTPYEALAISIGTALQDCGFEALVHGTPDACEVRSFVTGTNAATATLSIVGETGSDATDAGISIESAGAGDEVLFVSTSNTAKSGQFQIRVDDGISFSTTFLKSWAMSPSTPGTGWPDVDPVVSDRDISLEMDFESGVINGINHVETRYGRTIAVDSGQPIALEKDCTFTINDITDNDATADFTWHSGCGPSLREGFQILDATGMNEVDGRLFRGLSLTGAGTSSGSGQLWPAGTDSGRPVNGQFGTKQTVTVAGVPPPQLPNVRTSTVGYGNFSGTATAQTFKKSAYANGCCGVSHDFTMHVIQDGFVPPANLNGTADPLLWLGGTHCFQGHMDFWHPYDVWNTTKGFNNHRWSVAMRDVAEGHFIYNEEFALGWAVYLPTNWDHQDSGDGTTNDQNFDRGAIEI